MTTPCQKAQALCLLTCQRSPQQLLGAALGLLAACRVSHAGRGQDALPFEDVRLGPLVGRGSFGKVYRGVWNGTLVAIKVCQVHNPTWTGSMGGTGTIHRCTGSPQSVQLVATHQSSSKQTSVLPGLC